MTSRTWFWIVGVPATIIATYWALFMSPLPFLASWWDVDTAQPNMFRTRYRIADRLASGNRLDNMNRQEVIALLGEPVTDAKRMGNPDLLYVLGPERGLFSIDYEWLLIDFDPAGKVSKVVVASD